MQPHATEVSYPASRPVPRPLSRPLAGYGTARVCGCTAYEAVLTYMDNVMVLWLQYFLQLKQGTWIGEEFAKADSSLRSSQAVHHPSTNRALRRFTSEVERDPVHSTQYGSQRESMTQSP